MLRITTILLFILAAFVVTPVNAVGDCNQNLASQGSQTTNAGPGCGAPPTVPASITAPSSSDTGSYTVSWGSSSGSGTIHYKLYESFNGGADVQVENDSVFSKTLTGRASGTYLYSVKACYFGSPDCSGFRTASNNTVVTLPAPMPNTPAKPAVSTISSNGTFTVSWLAVNNATRYVLEEKANSGDWTNVPLTSTLSATVTRAEGKYWYQVKACNGTSLCSSFSAPLIVNYVLPPNAVPNITSSSTSTTYQSTADLTVSWTQVSNAISYDVEHTFNGVTDTKNTSERFSTYSNANLGNHTFKVRAKNNAGLSNWSASKTITLSQISNINGAARQRPAVTLVVTDIGEYIDVKVNNELAIDKQEGRTISMTLADGTHDFQARSCNMTDIGSATYACGNWGIKFQVDVVSRPGVPSSITRSGNTEYDGELSFQWGVASGEVHQYELRSQQINQTEKLETTVAFPAQNASLSNVSNGNYRYMVRACNTINGNKLCSLDKASSYQVVKNLKGLIPDWDLTQYGVYEGNFNANPGDETLLLGHKDIILLHGDIITPIAIFPTVHNAVVSWNASGTASFVEFNFDADPDNYAVNIGSLDSDSYDEIFLQAKSKGGTSHILNSAGEWVQSLKNGFLNIDWSSVAYSAGFANSDILLTALGANDDDNTAITNSSGAVTSLETAVTKPTISGTTQKYVFQDSYFRFKPSTSSSTGALIFSVSGNPTWMSLNPLNGTLSGTPRESDINKSHSITLTLKENKTHTIIVSMTFEIKVVESFSISETDYAVYQSSNGVIYLLAANNVDVYKIIEDNGKQIIVKITMSEFNAANASLLTGYQVIFEDRNYDGHIDLILQPIENSGLDTILISYIEASSHEVLDIDLPVRSEIDHGPISLPMPVTNPLEGSDTGTVVGSLPANFSVKPSGSAVYDVSIIVAPGTAGLQPSISVGYDSLAENGIMGVGWNINGLSVISICQENREQDGVSRPSAFGRGKYCLNGKKLDPDPATPNRFATQDKTSLNITRDVTSFNTDSQFTEHHIDGSKTIYRRVKVGQPEHMVYRIIDASNNYIEMVYEDEAFEAARLSKVLYTGNEVESLSPFNAIEFEYEERDDDIYKFRSQLQVNITKRLKKIISKVNTDASGDGGDELRTYTVDYIYGEVTKRSLVKGITACRASSCLPETSFDWEQGNLEYEDYYQYQNGDSYNNTHYGKPWGYLFLDFDGDGVIDYWKNKDDNGVNDHTDDLYAIKGGSTFEQIENVGNYLNQDLRYSIKKLDYNNDGKDDLIYKKNGYWHIILAKKMSANRYHDFDHPINTGIPAHTNNFRDIINESVLVADHDGDGFPDITYVYQEKLWLRYNLNIDLFAPITAGTKLFSEPVEISLEMTTPTDPSQYIIPEIYEELEEERLDVLEIFLRQIDYLFKTIDINGDGIAEYHIGVPRLAQESKGEAGTIFGTWFIYEHASSNGARMTSGVQKLMSAGEWYDKSNSHYSGGSRLGRMDSLLVDLNGDGLLDIFRMGEIYSSNTSTGDINLYYQLANGNENFSQYSDHNAHNNFLASFEEMVKSPITMNEFGDYEGDFSDFRPYFIDYNSDGYQDLIHGSQHDGNTYVRYFNGKKFEASQLIPINNADMPIRQLADLNGDGSIDYAYFYGRMYNQLSKSKKRDMIEGINDGSSVKRTIEYSPFVHIKDDDARHKSWGNGSLVKDVGGAIHLVKTTKKMNSTASSCNINTCYEWLDFEYKGLKAQLGRGLLGYREFNVTDHIHSKTVANEFRQDFPFIGMPLSRTTVVGGVGNTSSETLNVVYNINSFGLAYVQESTVKNYENNLLLSEKITTNFNVDEYGRPEITETVVLDPNNYQNFISTEEFRYELHDIHYGGRLTRKINTTSRVGESPISQVVDFEYYASNGLLRKTIADPTDYSGSSSANEGNQIYGVTEVYERDGFGNVLSTTTTGSDNLTRFVKHEYDELGRYQIDSYVYPNYPSLAGEIKVSSSYHSIFGVKISETSANNQTSYFGYSTLGRLNFQNSPDGTYSTIDKKICSTYTECPVRAYYFEETIQSHGPNSVVYYDGLGRKIEEKTESLQCYNTLGLADVCSGVQTRWVHKVYGYNNKSYKTIESRPHFADDLPVLTNFVNLYPPTGYASFLSDSRGRPIIEYRADRSKWETSYDGFTTTITNPDFQTTTKKVNALGELIEMIDAKGEIINYEYDSLGSLRLARRLLSNVSGGEDSIDTVIVSDHLGRKISMNDPDKGIVEYRYNSLGELIWKKDSKQQITISYYDAIGRNIESLTYSDYTNNVLDHHSKIYYDQAENGLGLVNKEEDLLNGITVESTFNIMSQVIRSKTTFANGQELFSDVVFDNLFRVKEVYDASNTYAGVRYSYYNNYLVEKTDLQSGILLWKFLAADALGSVSAFQYGNGVVNYNIRDQNDGTLEAIMAIKNGSQSLQHDVFNFNGLGNLEYREDVVVGMRESFNYDSINRLDDWTVEFQGTTATYDVNYDHLGNISFKSGIGFYQNGESHCGITAGPHAVTTAGSEKYCYDRNGNMISGGGRTNIQYNTNDKPVHITTNKNHRIDYHYGLGGMRFKRVDTATNGKTKETLYVGSVEFISEDGKLKKVLRHLEGVALETFIPKTGARQLEYLHRDHLGSVELITDLDANTVSKFSYDPWGQRRDETSYLPGNFADSAISFSREDFKRGFTGHEHIDEAGLIHMNGRVYDPRLARFLSADPFVKTTENLQSFNRYTYVSNNPLNATDPSGYLEASIQFGINWSGNSYNDSSGSMVFLSASNEFQRTNGNSNVQLAFGYDIANNAFSWDTYSVQSKQIDGGNVGDSSARMSVNKDGLNGVTVNNLSSGDIWQSYVAGAGNAFANAIDSYSNLMDEWEDSIWEGPCDEACARMEEIGLGRDKWREMSKNFQPGPGVGGVINVAKQGVRLGLSARPVVATKKAIDLFDNVPRALRQQVFDLMEAVPKALKGNIKALEMLSQRRPHALTGNLKGWNSLDIVPNQPGIAGSKLRFLYKETKKGIEYMIRDTH